MSMLDEALELSERGFAVFPVHSIVGGRCTCGGGKDCKPGKHPMTRNGFKDATTDRAVIQQWWTKHPAANIGLATGAPSGVWVLDLDRHGESDGEGTLRKLEEKYGRLPQTLSSRTGGGGRHFFFEYDPQRPVGSNQGGSKNRPGIDVRGDGGYAILPPSVHGSGKRYEWANKFMAASSAPSWLIDIAVNGIPKDDKRGRQTSPSTFAEVNAAALERIEDWAADLFPHGKFSANGAYRVTPSEAGHPDTEEGLSIHPDGIVDYGPEPPHTFTPIDLAMKYLPSTTAYEAARWLASKLGLALSDGEVRPTNLARPWPAPPDERAFYGLAGEITRAIEPHTEADPVAILAQILVAFGSIVGRRSRYYVDGTFHHPNLFAVIVGDTSKARKGTSWNRVRETFQGAELEDSWMTTCIIHGLSTGEGLIECVRDPAYDAEGELDDAGVDDKRLLIVEGEYSRPLSAGSRKDNTLSSVLRLAWDGVDLSIKTRKKPLTATRPHISLIGHITVEDLKRHLTTVEYANGFANRNIYICAKRSKSLPFGGDPDALRERLQPLQRRLKKVIRDACDTEHISLDERVADRTITFDKAAANLWREEYAALSEGGAGILGAVTARSEAQVVRLALAYALLDSSDTIRLEHLEAALALWRYAEASAAHIFGDMAGDADADKILGLLKRAGSRGLKRAEISKEIAGHHGADRVKQALELLLHNGLAVMEQKATAGRAAEVWRAT